MIIKTIDKININDLSDVRLPAVMILSEAAKKKKLRGLCFFVYFIWMEILLPLYGNKSFFMMVFKF